MKLEHFFNPTSIAIVGVSGNPQKVGHLVAKNMIAQGYTKDLFFVHPTEKELLGKQVYPSLSSIPKKLDLIVFAVPASVVIQSLDEVHELGCHNILIYAAGFKEMNNEEAKQHEIELLKKAQQYNLTILGPNCLGFINTKQGINATFLKDTAPQGNIGIISQSGALGSAFVDYLNAHKNIGISHFISLGNKSVINESDCLEFLAKDKDTTVIGMYLENVVNGNRFREVLSKVAQQKPVVIIKGGSTQEGSQAALSHTGSMVGDDAVFEAAVEQSYAIRVHSYADFQTILQLFSFGRIPSSRHILVLSNAGGMGVLLADKLIEKNLSLVTISEGTHKKIMKAFDNVEKITIHNPIDLLGDASAFDYERAIASTMKEKDVGAVVILLTPQANTEIMPTAKVIADAQHIFGRSKKYFKPIYPVFMGETSVKEAQNFFEQEEMASFYQYDQLPYLLAHILDRKDVLEMTPIQLEDMSNIVLGAHDLDIKTILLENKGKPYLNQVDSLQLLQFSGLKTAKTYHIASEENIKTVLEKEGYPLVAKIASDKITHKTEVKGVITGLNSWEELIDAYTHLAALSTSGTECYLQKQYSGHELIIGAKRDITFGTVVMVGLGGIYAELLKETVQFVYPFPYDYFAWTLNRTKMKKLIDGYRNTPPLNVKQVYESALHVGMLMEKYPDISEIDINPLMIKGEETIVVDGRIILSSYDH
ncbi:MAG TPA: acetate--CoA ligase family protein [Candidatus Woesebacteria bacterium]|nr:acetate--CoA ligase family protein [Candidatus Woesebacteria bacterium]